MIFENGRDSFDVMSIYFIAFSQHLPILLLILKQYDFEISNARRADDRDEVYSRVSNLPALINLGS